MILIFEDKSFGYPVLRPLLAGQKPSDLDYVNTPFEPSLGMEFDRSDTDSFIFTWEYDCPVESIRELIHAGDIKVTLNISNRTTWLSHNSDLTNEGYEGEVSLDKNVFSGEIDVRLVLTAATDIEISADCIHSDYGYSFFKVEKHSLVGFSDVATYDARPNLLQKINSIFVFNEEPDLEDGEFFYDHSGEKVDIFANEDLILRLRSFEASEKHQNYVLSAVYAPIIRDLLKIVLEKQHDEDDPETQLLWFRTIQQKLSDLPPSKVQQHRPEIAAHHLVKKPLTKVSVE